VDSETKTLRNTIKRKPRLLQCNKTSCITTEFKITFYSPYWFSHISVYFSCEYLVADQNNVDFILKTSLSGHPYGLSLKWSSSYVCNFQIRHLEKTQICFLPIKACFRLTFSSVFLLSFDGYTFLYNLLFRFTFFTTTTSFTL